jgi:hypothetical protein
MGRLAALAVAVLFAAVVTRAQGHEHGQMQGPAQGKEQVIKTGKKGKIHLSQDTQVGDLTLKAGEYWVQHRLEGSDHFIHFTELSKSAPYSRSEYPKSHPGEIKCRLEQLDAKATQTEVHVAKEDGSWRVTKVVIRGENVSHLF